MSRDNKVRCVYDLTPWEIQELESLLKELNSSRVGFLREIIKPGPIRDAIIKLWEEVKHD